MLKIKSILLGVFSSLTVFFLFAVILGFTAAKLGVIVPAVYQNLMMFFAVAAILIGSFAAAKTAGGRGALYGLLLSGLWILSTFGISAAMGLMGEAVGIGLRVVLYLIGGQLGGIAGVSLKRRTKYI